MSDNTNQLLDTLITQVASLTESVDKLVTMDAVRMEKDKHQEEKNEKFERFISETTPVINKSKDWQEKTAKASVPIIVFLVLGFLTMAGVNFAG